MIVFVKNPGQPGAFEAKPEGMGTLEFLQAKVGGYVDMVGHQGLDFWVNDEGLLMEMQPNIWLHGQIIVGPIVVAASNGEGETVGLTEEQQKRVQLMLG